MKARKPILRKTPLKKSTKPIARKTPLARSTKEIKRTAIRPGTKSGSLQELENKAVKFYNAHIRKRDRYDDFTFVCIACNICKDIEEMQCGHYMPGTYSELKFNELNTHGECISCNCGDIYHLIGYRINLIKKIGEENVLWLESHRMGNAFKVDRQYYQDIIDKYTNKD